VIVRRLLVARGWIMTDLMRGPRPGMM